jgi:hypothetical protein
MNVRFLTENWTLRIERRSHIDGRGRPEFVDTLVIFRIPVDFMFRLNDQELPDATPAFRACNLSGCPGLCFVGKRPVH